MRYHPAKLDMGLTAAFFRFGAVASGRSAAAGGAARFPFGGRYLPTEDDVCGAFASAVVRSRLHARVSAARARSRLRVRSES